MSGGPDIPGESALRSFPDPGQPADTAVIARLTCQASARGDAVAIPRMEFPHAGSSFKVNLLPAHLRVARRKAAWMQAKTAFFA